MFVRLSVAIATLSLLSSAAMAQAAKPTDPQIAHIAYTAGVIDINAAKQAMSKARSIILDRIRAVATPKCPRLGN